MTERRVLEEGGLNTAGERGAKKHRGMDKGVTLLAAGVPTHPIIAITAFFCFGLIKYYLTLYFQCCGTIDPSPTYCLCSYIVQMYFGYEYGYSYDNFM